MFIKKYSKLVLKISIEKLLLLKTILLKKIKNIK